MYPSALPTLPVSRVFKGSDGQGSALVAGPQSCVVPVTLINTAGPAAVPARDGARSCMVNPPTKGVPLALTVVLLVVTLCTKPRALVSPNPCVVEAVRLAKPMLGVMVAVNLPVASV